MSTIATSTPSSTRHVVHGHNQILPLNAIRGIAALLVVFSHLHDFPFAQLGPPVEGSLGVLLFFTLSGFLMGHLYLHKPLDRNALFGYAVARFSRIAPPYLIVVITGFLIYTLVDPSFPYAIRPSQLPRHLLFSGNVSVLWSIAPEVQFYAFFVAVWWAVHRMVAHRSAAALIALAALCIAMISVRSQVPGTFVASKLPLFLIGTFLGWLHRRVPPGAVQAAGLLWLQIVLIALLGVFVAGIVPMGQEYWFDITPALVAGLAIFAFSRDVTPIDRVLRAPLLQRLGDWSFSIYLLHVPLLWALSKTGLFATTLASTLAAVCLAVAGSAVFSVFIEHPACAATRRFLLARTRKPPQSAGPLSSPSQV